MKPVGIIANPASGKDIRRLVAHGSVVTSNEKINMVKRILLERTGLFDPAFDHGERADHDLGMRCYLSGALMVLNPDIRVRHLRAPKGGLREHGARVITYAASRAKLLKWQVMSPTELYLAEKYFSLLQTREAILQSAFGSLSIKGNWIKKCVKMGTGVLILPYTIYKLNQNKIIAHKLKKHGHNPSFIPEPTSYHPS